MSVQREYATRTVDTSSSSYVENCKSWVQAILDISPIFTLHETITDTSSVYKVRLRISDTPIYLDVYNSTTTLKIDVQADTGGTFTVMKSSTLGSSTSNSIPIKQLHFSRFDNFLWTLMFYVPGASSGGMAVYFGKAYAENLKTDLYFGYSVGPSTIVPSTGMLPITNLSTVISALRSDLQTVETYTFAPEYPDWTYIGAYSSNPYVMTQTGFYAYCKETGKLAWTGHLKWDGQYDLFHLYDTASPTAVDKAGTYKVDGTAYPAAFCQLYLPKACT